LKNKTILVKGHFLPNVTRKTSETSLIQMVKVSN